MIECIILRLDDENHYFPKSLKTKYKLKRTKLNRYTPNICNIDDESNYFVEISTSSKQTISPKTIEEGFHRSLRFFFLK